ncbi:MAG: CHAT domain-containing protein [Longimonas sp.]|uniref:CHAT domain-containing protein n=1 Tax=Longimonas sp. TaxID=2039626 RepID=UPI003352ABD9
MSFLGALLFAFVLSGGSAAVSDTTNADDRPTLRECGMMMVPLQETYQRAFTMQDSPERRALLQEAEQSIRAVQDCYEERRPRVVMSTYRALVAAQYEQGRPDAALASFEEFFGRFQPSDDSTMVSWMYSQRGQYHYLLGYSSRSLRDYTRAVALTPQEAIDTRMQRTNNLAITYDNLQELQSALYYLRQTVAAVDDVAEITPNIQLEYGRALALKASVLQQMIYVGEADANETLPRIETLTARAFDELQPIDRDLAIGSLLTVANVYLYKHRTEEASDVLDRVQKYVDESISLNRKASLFQLQAQLAIQNGRMGDAERYLEESRRVAVQQGLVAQQRQVRTQIGQLHEQNGDLEAAVEHYSVAAELTDAENESIRATLWSTRTLEQRRGGYDGLMRTLRRQGRTAEAFDVWSQFRARFLRDTRMQTALLEDMSPDMRMRYDSLTTALNTVRMRRSESDADNEEATMRQEAVLIAERSDLFDFAEQSFQTDRHALQRWLGDTNRTLIAYHVDTPTLYNNELASVAAYVVRPDTVIAVDIPHTAEALGEMVGRISPLLANDDPPVSLNLAAFNLDALHEAYDALVGPIQSYLPDDSSLIVAADGPLFQLPFGALVTEAPPSPYAYNEARYLIEERPILSTLSPALLLEDTSVEAREVPIDLAAFGRSDFGKDAPPDDMIASEIRTRSGADSLSLGSLPGVAIELERLGGMFRHTVMALNEEATPSAVRTHSANAKVVHLASHALLSLSDPLNSAFVLAEEPGRDGLLRVHDIMTPGSQVPLVVLSGCSTARGELRSGEGLLGLQYAFQASGAQSTLSHLWPTDDDTAVALSTYFYEALRSGIPKDAALQRAQLAFIEAHPDRRSPFFWGSPVLFGSPNALDLAPAVSLWTRVGWGMLTLVGGGLIFLFIRIYRSSPTYA